MIPRCLIWAVFAFVTGGWVLAAPGWREFEKRPEEWFKGAEAREVAERVLSWQAPGGAWPKNSATFGERYSGERERLRGTFDNGATTDELRFLARIHRATGEARYRQAFERGLQHILEAQYANGGWPQYYPPPKDGYARHVTFNDNTMARLMEFVRAVSQEEAYAFVDKETRERCAHAFERGVDCILKSQIEVDGVLTAWCAQHDAEDLSPQGARSYELPSLSGSETVGILRLLMSIEEPSPEVVRAVEAAVKWLEEVKIEGIRVETVQDPNAPRGRDRVVVRNANAKPMWARFYEIGSNRPFFCGRDGVKKYSLAEIEHERRNGYSWLGYYAEGLLEKDYPRWKERLPDRE